MQQHHIMPPRIARANVSVAAPKNARNKTRKRNLDAYSIASHSTKDKRKVPQHRLGEILDDGPKQKRRRVDDDDEDDDAEGEDEGEDEHKKAPRRQTQPGNNDDVEQGSDSSGNEWTLGGLAEDDDDSDLDSDEAFGESDEERFEGFTFRGSSKGARKPVKKTVYRATDNGEIDLSEGENAAEDEEDEFGEEGVDLATMLDDADEEMGGQGNAEDSGSEEDGEESSSDEEDDDDDEGAGDEERVARMRDRLEGLDRAAGSGSRPDNAEAGIISVDDLLADLDPVERSQFSAALKTKKRSAKPMTLAAPLPKRQQDKLNRGIALDKAKEQLDRWRDTVMQNRRAEFLSFPLSDPNANIPLGKEKFVPAVPQTELEQNIQRIMEESGMSSTPGRAGETEAETNLLKAEELATNKLPIEEVERRRAELRRARELLFREEIKAKRIAKIKSKSYRRVHRREREKQARKEREDAEAAGIVDEDEADHFDRKRAEERMSTKHRESKWAKSLKATNRTAWDEDARDSVFDQARRNEELKQRIAGKGVYDGEGSDVPSGESDDDDHDESTTTLRQLGRLKQDDGRVGETGLANMKFMRAAEARTRAQNDEDVARMRKDLAIEDGDEDSESEIDDQGLGRAIFGPKAKEGREVEPATRKPELEEAEDSDEAERREAAERGLTDAETRPMLSAPKSILKRSSTASGPLARTQQLRNTRASNNTDGNVWLNGNGEVKSKKDKARQRAGDDGDVIAVDIATEAPNKAGLKSAKKDVVKQTADANGTQAHNTDGWQTVPYKFTSGNDDSNDETSDHENATIIADPKSSFQSRAFAGDDVALAFQIEKDAAEASEDEKEISTHLPGWGSWTGENLSKAIRKSNSRLKHNPLYKTKLPGGVSREHRKDQGRENVIISEKQDRKGKKFLAPVLPHQYLGQLGGKDVYERSLRMPMGPEWSTKEVFQRSTRPRVVVKKGTVIEAMEKPMV